MSESGKVANHVDHPNSKVSPKKDELPTQNLWRLPGDLPALAKKKKGLATKLSCGVLGRGTKGRMGPWLPLNPFVEHLSLPTAYQKIKVLLMTVTVMPLRVVSILICLIVAWIVAFIGLAGAGSMDKHDKPISGWRKEFRSVVCGMVRLLFAFGGFQWVTIKGKQASPKEAPILALAPHSTYFDALPVVCLGAPSIVAKGETQYLPFFGKFISFTEPLYVFREDANSRQNTIDEMKKRAKEPDMWPQVLIFPEGTCTNRSCLITFKPGAFIPGVPVQPVCIRYPNKLDTVTWTWLGASFFKIFWMTLTQFHSYCEIEFLPVYVPSPEEQENPKLYASNVRQLMARALNIPLTEYAYEDCRLLLKLDTLDFGRDVEQFQRLRLEIGLDSSAEEEALVTAWLEEDNQQNNSTDTTSLRDALVTMEEMCGILRLPVGPTSRELFCTLCKKEKKKNDKNDWGYESKIPKMEVNLYVVLVCWLGSSQRSTQALRVLYNYLEPDTNGEVDLEKLRNVTRPGQTFKPDEVRRLFRQLDRQERGVVNFEDFQEVIRLKPEYINLFVILHRRILTALHDGLELTPGSFTPGSPGSSASGSQGSTSTALSIGSWNSVKSKDE